jgi:preprotein translocase subunit SecB
MSPHKKQESAPQSKATFELLKLYVKDASFQVPEGLSIFQHPWTPELGLKVAVEPVKLAEKDTYEVMLKVAIEVKTQEKVAFLAEVQQVGIFGVAHLSEQDLMYSLHAFCPDLLYMYARELLADLVQKAGFPQLNLAPINFEEMHRQELNKRQNKESASV